MKTTTSVLDFRRASKLGLLDASFAEKVAALPTSSARNAALSEAPADVLNGIGPVTTRALKKMGVNTAMDVAYVAPSSPLAKSLYPRQTAAVVSLQAGLSDCLKPIERTVEPPRGEPPARPAATLSWEQRELSRARRANNGSILVDVSRGTHRNGWAQYETVGMTDQEYLAHRRFQSEHQFHLETLTKPWL